MTLKRAVSDDEAFRNPGAEREAKQKLEADMELELKARMTDRKKARVVDQEWDEQYDSDRGVTIYYYISTVV